MDAVARQREIDMAIVNALIESTPEEWTEIVLALKRAGPEVGSIEHEMRSPAWNRPCAPVDELFQAAYQLDALLRTKGGILESATYRAELKGGGWTWSAEIGYQGAL